MDSERIPCGLPKRMSEIRNQRSEAKENLSLKSDIRLQFDL